MLIEDTDVERRCQTLVDALPLPAPFSLTALVGSIADQAGQRIDLYPLGEDVDPGVTAFIVATEHGYRLHHPAEDDPWRTLVCVSHELAHVMCGHVTSSAALAGGRATGRRAEALMPHLHDARAAWGGRLYRCDLTGTREHEAELVATLLVERIEEIHSGRAGGHAGSGADPVLARYTRALEGTRSRRARS